MLALEKRAVSKKKKTSHRQPKSSLNRRPFLHHNDMMKHGQIIKIVIYDTVKYGNSNGIEIGGDLHIWKWKRRSGDFLIISRWQFSFDWNSNRFLCFGSNIIWCEKTFHDVNDQFWYLLMKIVFCSCCREFPPLQITYETSPST